MRVAWNWKACSITGTSRRWMRLAQPPRARASSVDRRGRRARLWPWSSTVTVLPPTSRMKPEVLAAVALVELDQAAAELGLEDPRQDQHRRVQPAAGVRLDRRQRGEQREHPLDLGERRRGQHPQHRVEHQPAAAIDRRRPVRRVDERPEAPADRAVLVEEEADPGQAFLEAAAGLVLGIDADPEEARPDVVEQPPLPAQRGERAAHRLLRRRAEEGQHHVAPGDAREVVVRAAVAGAGAEQGHRIARSKRRQQLHRATPIAPRQPAIYAAGGALIRDRLRAAASTSFQRAARQAAVAIGPRSRSKPRPLFATWSACATWPDTGPLDTRSTHDYHPAK